MRRRSPVIPAMLAVIALVLLPAISNIEANTLPPSWAPFLWIAWPAGLLLAVPLVYLEIRQRHHSHGLVSEHGAASADERRRLDRAATDLAAAVTRQWTAEVGLRSGWGATPLRVRWSVTPRPGAPKLVDVVTAEAVPRRPVAIRGDTTEQMVTLLGTIQDRQLVILGEPGAGKTVLALLFVLQLLKHRQSDDPVPVMLTMSSWNPAAEDLRTWLARRIVEEYPALGNEQVYGDAAATALVAEGRVLAVLDGLDEMPASAQPAAINAINHAAGAEHPVIVTCRSEEYEAAVTSSDAFFRRAAVLHVQPVDLADAGRFLAAAAPDGGHRWQPVLDKLAARPDEPLAKVLARPLMIALASTVYAASASSPDELLDEARFTEQGQIERHLFDAFIRVAYQDTPPIPETPPAPRYPPRQALAWLAFLARHHRRLDTDDLAWWHLFDPMPRLTRALCAAVPVGLLFGLSGTLVTGPVNGAGSALIFGLVTALAVIFGQPRPPTRVQLRFHGTAKPFIARFTASAMVGLGLALAYGLPVLATVGSGLVFGLAFAPRVWLDVPTDAAEASNPGIGLRQNRTAALGFGLTLGVALGFIAGVGIVTVDSELTIATPNGLSRLLVGALGTAVAGGFAGNVGYGRAGAIAFGIPGAITFGTTAVIALGLGGATVRALNVSLAHGLVHNGTAGVWYGITFGLAAGVTGVIARAWGSFCLARTWLALRGHLPWRLMRFLNDAHRRGVLRQSGAVYQFRHAALRDHLANTNMDDQQPQPT